MQYAFYVIEREDGQPIPMTTPRFPGDDEEVEYIIFDLYSQALAWADEYLEGATFHYRINLVEVDSEVCAIETQCTSNPMGGD